MCGFDYTIVSYFYRKKEFCPDCDAQSFVLSDIKKDLEDLERDEELLIFSFDADLELPAVNILIRHYNITEYPSIIIDDRPYTGLYKKNGLKKMLCKDNNLSICA